jgi:hypothetical protein
MELFAFLGRIVEGAPAYNKQAGTMLSPEIIQLTHPPLPQLKLLH